METETALTHQRCLCDGQAMDAACDPHRFPKQQPLAVLAGIDIGWASPTVFIGAALYPCGALLVEHCQTWTETPLADVLFELSNKGMKPPAHIALGPDGDRHDVVSSMSPLDICRVWAPTSRVSGVPFIDRVEAVRKSIVYPQYPIRLLVRPWLTDLRDALMRYRWCPSSPETGSEVTRSYGHYVAAIGYLVVSAPRVARGLAEQQSPS